MLELVLLVIAGLVTSEPVTVALPEVFKVTLKVWVPAARELSEGKLALLSLEVMWTVSFVLTRFQLASTALTVTLNAVPEVWVVAVPVLPEAVPGAAVSPGVSTCSLTKAPGLTVIAGLVLAVMPT